MIIKRTHLRWSRKPNGCRLIRYGVLRVPRILIDHSKKPKFCGMSGILTCGVGRRYKWPSTMNFGEFLLFFGIDRLIGFNE
jgi:hypothetical protein